MSGKGRLVLCKGVLIVVPDDGAEYRVGPGAVPYLVPWFAAHECHDGLWPGAPSQTARLRADRPP